MSEMVNELRKENSSLKKDILALQNSSNYPNVNESTTLSPMVTNFQSSDSYPINGSTPYNTNTDDKFILNQQEVTKVFAYLFHTNLHEMSMEVSDIIENRNMSHNQEILLEIKQIHQLLSSIVSDRRHTPAGYSMEEIYKSKGEKI